MAAVYDLSQYIAQAQQPSSAPPPPPVSSAPTSPFAQPRRPQSYAIPGIGQVDPNAAAPQANPNDSPFAQAMAPYKIDSAPSPVPDVAPSMIERTKNFFGGNDATTAQLNVRQKAADVLAHPEVLNMAKNSPQVAAMLQADPVGAATKLQPLIEAMAGNHPSSVAHPNADGTVTTKAVPDPAHLSAVAKIADAKHEEMSPFLNHHTYSDEEFINATQHLNWKQAARMFGAAQRLTPQQQITNSYAGIVHDNAERAHAAYQAAVESKVPKAQLDKLGEERDKANGELKAFVKKISEGSQSMFPDSAIQ
jgi:hypothetical protein